MQDAYFVDQNEIGTWTLIGYKEPVSKNFEYSGSTATSGKTWIAVAQFDTDDCESNEWSVETNKDATGKTIVYQASDNCPALTPNFKNIGTSN